VLKSGVIKSKSLDNSWKVGVTKNQHRMFRGKTSKLVVNPFEKKLYRGAGTKNQANFVTGTKKAQV